MLLEPYLAWYDSPQPLSRIANLNPCINLTFLVGKLSKLPAPFATSFLKWNIQTSNSWLGPTESEGLQRSTTNHQVCSFFFVVHGVPFKKDIAHPLQNYKQKDLVSNSESWSCKPIFLWGLSVVIRSFSTYPGHFWSPVIDSPPHQVLQVLAGLPRPDWHFKSGHPTPNWEQQNLGGRIFKAFSGWWFQPTPLKHISQNWESFPHFRGEHKTYWKPPSSFFTGISKDRWGVESLGGYILCLDVDVCKDENCALPAVRVCASLKWHFIILIGLQSPRVDSKILSIK